jgi:predicted amidohydrolase YtcJ
MLDQKKPIETEADNAISIPRRRFLVGAGTGVASGVALRTPVVAQTSVAPGQSAVAVADIVLKNGKVITVDPTFTIASAIAVAGDRILAVGPNEAMAAHTGPRTRIVDLHNRAVIPGITDGHAHMDREGLRNIFPSLGRVRSIGDIQDRIAELARGKAPGEWIVTMPIGDPPYYFDVPDILAEKRWPTRHELDVAAPQNPVFIRPIWGYWRGTVPLVSIANTEALKLAGITRDTVSPSLTLKVEKDANGDPTGVFIENEMAPIAELIWFRKPAAFSHVDRVKALRESEHTYHAFATTSVFEGHGAGTELLRVYKECLRDGTLTMRTTLAFSADWRAAEGVPLGPFVEAWAGWLGEPGMGDDWLKMGGLFVQVGRTAADEVRATAAPYTGWAGFNASHGLPRDRVKELLVHCAENDIRPVVIGSENLDLYDDVDREIPLNGRRWVISHISTFSKKDIERIARMGLVVTTHTNNYLYKGLSALARRLPPEQHGEIVPLRSLLDAGVKVSFATDNVPVSNFLPISQAIRRLPYQMQEPVAPEQALTRADALRCATNFGAYLTFDESNKGSLEPGKLADLAVLSVDPLTVAEAGIAEIQALMTMVGGKIVYETPSWVE